jgi:hypothetical protein
VPELKANPNVATLEQIGIFAVFAANLLEGCME